MTAANLSLLNAVLLIALGVVGYALPENPSKTALIPVGFGIALLLCNPGVRKNNAVIAHVAVLLTLVVFIALVKPLRGAIGREDSAAIGRIVIMILSSALALFAFIKSFVDVRRSRVASNSAVTPVAPEETR